MGNTLDNLAKKRIATADIVKMGEKLVIPADMTADEAIDLLEQMKAYNEEVTSFDEFYDVLPFDGAVALSVILATRYGWAKQVPTPGFFGPTPPKILTVATGFQETRQVPWGRFAIPGVDGVLETNVTRKNGRLTFVLSAKIKRSGEEVVRQIGNEVREYLKSNSIYKGKAVKIRFLDDAGDPLNMPEVEFLDHKAVKPENLIYAKQVQTDVDVNLFTPIREYKKCLENGVPLKRGVLLGGPYGTGKTMAASAASFLAVEAGLTYLYLPRANELSNGIEFAKQYQNPACVIFCEDVDRVTDGDRSVKMDDILNIIDGIDTKGANIITVLTTNELDNIHPAMLRPGRLDAVINVTAPDAEAAAKVVAYYAGSALKEGEDLTPVGVALAGMIPAAISEVVKRAKLAQMRLDNGAKELGKITAQAILDAAATMQNQMSLLNRDRSAPAITIDSIIGDSVQAEVSKQLAPVLHQLKVIENHVS